MVGVKEVLDDLAALKASSTKCGSVQNLKARLKSALKVRRDWFIALDQTCSCCEVSPILVLQEARLIYEVRKQSYNF